MLQKQALKSKFSTASFPFFAICVALLIGSTFSSSPPLIDSEVQNFFDASRSNIFPTEVFADDNNSIARRIAISIATCSAIALVIWLFSRTIGSRGLSAFERFDSILTEPHIQLVFHITSEFSRLLYTVKERIMSYVGMPVGVGLDIASSLTGKDLRTRHRYSNSLSTPPTPASSSRTGRKSNISSNMTASSSTPAALNGAGYYPGLWNTGNSCFLNSTLQSLASIASLRTLLESIIHDAEEWDVPTPITDALYEIVMQLNTPTQRHDAIIPRQLTDALSNLSQSNVRSFFNAHQQQDAHELLVLITNALDDEMMNITAGRQTAMHKQQDGLRAIFAEKSNSSNQTTMYNPFRALVAQRTACLDCSYVEAVRHFQTDELSLNVPTRARSTTTIETCLLNWSRLEVVDWICFRCSLVRTLERIRREAATLGDAVAKPSSPSAKKKSGAKRRHLKELKSKEDALLEIAKNGYAEDDEQVKRLCEEHELKFDRSFSRAATKQVMLARTPSILVIHLNRSSYSSSNFGASKNNANVLFDEYLDLAEVVTGGDLNIIGDRPISRGVTPALDDTMNSKSAHVPVSMKTLYRLCAIVVHYGGHSAGHYVAFRRRSARSSNGDTDIDVDSIKRTNGKAQTMANESDRWYRISDDSVSQCHLQDVLTQNPFLLFYEKVRDPDVDGKAKDAPPKSNANGNGINGKSHVPKGFETFRNTLDRRFQARILQRWETIHEVKTNGGVENGLLQNGHQKKAIE